MPEHVYFDGCENRDCGGSCWYCTLSICKICDLYEGSLTTDCPGKKSYKYADDIYNGKLDYKDGLGWVKELNPANVSWLYGKYLAFYGSDNKFIKQKKINPFEFKKIKRQWEKEGAI